MSRGPKPKKRLCCQVNALGKCHLCNIPVCSNHGVGYSYSSVPGAKPHYFKCKSTQCNYSRVLGARQVAARKGLVKEEPKRYMRNVRGERLLERINKK